jgi:hypothetical protein
MKRLGLAFMQIFYMQCIREVRIYILFLSIGLNIKKKFVAVKTCS